MRVFLFLAGGAAIFYGISRIRKAEPTGEGEAGESIEEGTPFFPDGDELSSVFDKGKEFFGDAVERVSSIGLNEKEITDACGCSS